MTLRMSSGFETTVSEYCGLLSQHHHSKTSATSLRTPPLRLNLVRRANQDFIDIYALWLCHDKRDCSGDVFRRELLHRFKKVFGG